MTGRLSLYFNGSIVATKRYDSPGRKQEFINTWMRLYGKGFIKAVVVDDPDPATHQRSEYGKDPNYERNKILRERKKAKLPPHTE